MKNEENIDYEAKVEELRNIVNKLESDVSLEEGMKLFEEGLKLTKECIEHLNKAQECVASLKKQLDGVLDGVNGGNDER